MKQETQDWVTKAEGDRRVAGREMQAADPVYDVICFLAQQCAEKYLKAWLVEQGIAFAKIHDLVVLLNLTGAGLPPLQGERTPLARLSTFAVAARYPGIAATEQEADESIKTAERVRAIIRAALGGLP